MSYSSVFDILKIGVGPSSSHTLGPWKAGLDLISIILPNLKQVSKITVSFYGSLSLTGKGHASDIAVMLGICGFQPDTFPIQNIESEIEAIKTHKVLNVNGEHKISFDPDVDIKYSQTFLPFHPNGMIFTVIEQTQAHTHTYYSIGGGFIVKDGEKEQEVLKVPVPFQIYKGEHLKEYLLSYPNFKISDFARKNEIALGKTEEEVNNSVLKIWDVMTNSIFTGIKASGVLPGSLNVKRRAGDMLQTISNANYSTKKEFFDAIKNQNFSFDNILDFVNLFAIAVNEVNASLGRVVTAPTNGSAGVIPAVLSYYICFVNKKASLNDIVNFLLTAGVIGGIFKHGATISAAFGGCQAEIGVSSAMAASALTELKGGTVEQCLVASEIAMEHHLGMTCDPIDGLVQIPCIERNAMGAIKAINASNLALKTNPSSVKIELDEVVKAMLETAKDMNTKYKETSMAGLAKVLVNINEC